MKCLYAESKQVSSHVEFVKYELPLTFVSFCLWLIFCRYKNGDRLTPEHQKVIVERLLPYHPTYETKIGCGVESIMVCASTFCIFLATWENFLWCWYCANLCSMENLLLQSESGKHVSIHRQSFAFKKNITFANKFCLFHSKYDTLTRVVILMTVLNVVLIYAANCNPLRTKNC